MDICRGRDDVVVARHDQWLLQLKPLMCVFSKTLHPFDFICIFIGASRVAVGQVDRRHPQDPGLGRDRRLDEAGMVVGGIAGQPRCDLVELELGQDGDPVEGLLAVHGNVVTQRLDLVPRERLVHGLGLLQADDVGRPFGEPGGQIFDSLFDRIDVPGGDAHEGFYRLRLSDKH